MEMIARAYFGWFWCFYTLFERAPSRWASAWKAGLCITVLEAWMAFALGIGYLAVTKAEFPMSVERWFVIVVGAGIGLFNYFVFLHGDRWREHTKEFGEMSSRQRALSWVWFWLINLFAVSSLAVAFYVMSQIDWQALNGR